jgi:hypothetical protein
VPRNKITRRNDPGTQALAKAREAHILHPAIADEADELAAIIITAAAPASVIAIAHHDAALDDIAVAAAVDVADFGDIGPAPPPAAIFDVANTAVDGLARIAVAAIVITIIAAIISAAIIAIAIIIAAIVITIIVRRQDRRQPAEDDGTGDNLASADPVAVAVARGCGGALLRVEKRLAILASMGGPHLLRTVMDWLVIRP